MASTKIVHTSRHQLFSSAGFPKDEHAGLGGGNLFESGIDEGQALVFVSGSTAGVTTVEFEPGLVRDIKEFTGFL